MKAMLDTNICIYIIKKQPQSVLDKLLASSTADIGISAITVAELRYGATKSEQSQRNHNALDEFLSSFEIAAFDQPATVTYGKIRTALEKKGRPVGPLDTLIAAHALSLEIPLITNNEKEFRQVPDLIVENWV